MLKGWVNLPAENGAKALRSLTISGREYQRSGMNAEALVYVFSSVGVFLVSFWSNLKIGRRGRKERGG